jgi:hypothetical protein
LGVARPLNIQSEPIPLGQIICMDHGRARDWGGTEGRCGVAI